MHCSYAAEVCDVFTCSLVGLRCAHLFRSVRCVGCLFCSLVGLRHLSDLACHPSNIYIYIYIYIDTTPSWTKRRTLLYFPNRRSLANTFFDRPLSTDLSVRLFFDRACVTNEMCQNSCKQHVSYISVACGMHDDSLLMHVDVLGSFA